MISCDFTKARSFARNLFGVNYRLFAHSDVSYGGSMEKVITSC